MQFDGTQVALSANVLIDDFQGKSALIFLRKDEDNYYALEFNAELKKDIRLISYLNGVGQVL